MKKAGATLAVIMICVFLLTLHFGIPAPNILNRTYTGVVVNIREPDGGLSVNNLELGQEEAQNVLTAVQSRSYATLVPNGTVIAYAPAQEVILSLIYQDNGRDAYTTFTISSFGIITIEGDTYVLFPKSDRAQIQLFQTIYDSIPK